MPLGHITNVFLIVCTVALLLLLNKLQISSVRPKQVLLVIWPKHQNVMQPCSSSGPCRLCTYGFHTKVGAGAIDNIAKSEFKHNLMTCSCSCMALFATGKTTLMDVICGRKTVGRTTGSLLVNGQPLVKSSWSRVVGYVEQMDVHTSAQTVIEALWFSGRLRLGPKLSDQQVCNGMMASWSINIYQIWLAEEETCCRIILLAQASRATQTNNTVLA